MGLWVPLLGRFLWPLLAVAATALDCRRRSLCFSEAVEQATVKSQGINARRRYRANHRYREENGTVLKNSEEPSRTWAWMDQVRSEKAAVIVMVGCALL